MPHMKLNRNFTLRSKSGHTIGFEKDEPSFVPPAVAEEAVSIGAVYVDEKDRPEPAKENEPKPDPVGAERKKLVKAAIGEFIRANKRGDFNAAGRVHLKVLIAKLGFEIDARERDAVQDEVMAQTNEA